MPEMTFRIRWPDGRESVCYSPSRVVADHLAPATAYPLAEFLARSRDALLAASERVRLRHGATCGRALAQLDRIERDAAAFEAEPGTTVVVLSVRNDVDTEPGREFGP